MQRLVVLVLWVGCAESTRSSPDHLVPSLPDLSTNAPAAAADLAGAPDFASNVNPNDQDGDGSLGGVDCDDHDATVHPGAPEVCDGKDNDCDGFADNNAVDATTWYPDLDH